MVYENAFNFKDKEDDEEELNIKKEFKKNAPQLVELFTDKSFPKIKNYTKEHIEESLAIYEDLTEWIDSQKVFLQDFQGNPSQLSF